MRSLLLDVLLIILVVAILMHLYQNNALFVDCSESAPQNRETFTSLYDHIKKFITNQSNNNTEVMNRMDEMGTVISQKIQDSDQSVEDNASADIDQPTKIEMTSEANYKAGCPVLPGTENTKRYLRNYVLSGRKYCDCLSADEEREVSTRKNIDSYREKQLEFRDMVYGTSMKADDAVDQMAQIALKGGFDANGQTIANVYDRLTCAGSGKSVGLSVGGLDGWGFADGTGIGSNKCVIPPRLNTSGPMIEANYIAEIPKSGMMCGKYYENYDAKYNNDMTDQMHAHDQMFEDQPIFE